jgi:hypothetical protein
MWVERGCEWSEKGSKTSRIADLRWMATKTEPNLSWRFRTSQPRDEAYLNHGEKSTSDDLGRVRMEHNVGMQTHNVRNCQRSGWIKYVSTQAYIEVPWHISSERLRWAKVSSEDWCL